MREKTAEGGTDLPKKKTFSRRGFISATGAAAVTLSAPSMSAESGSAHNTNPDSNFKTKAFANIDGTLKPIEVELTPDIMRTIPGNTDTAHLQALIQRQVNASMKTKSLLGIPRNGIKKITYTTEVPPGAKILMTPDLALLKQVRGPIRLDSDDRWECNEMESCACTWCTVICWCQWEVDG